MSTETPDTPQGTPSTPDAPTDATAAPSDPPTGTEGATDPDSGTTETPNREAARYRRQLRAAETERDALAEQLDAMRRAEVARVAETEHGIRGAALWAVHPELDGLLAEDGTVDLEALAAAAEAAREQLGIVRPGGPVVPKSGTGGGNTSGATPKWADVIKGRTG